MAGEERVTRSRTLKPRDGRSHPPRGPAGSAARRHHARLGHARQQRDRHHQRRSRELAEVAHDGRRATSTPTPCRRSARCRSTSQDLGVDAASFSGHKIYGPKGVGVAVPARGARRSDPLLRGGGQEFKKRSRHAERRRASSGSRRRSSSCSTEQATEAVASRGAARQGHRRRDVARSRTPRPTVKRQGARLPSIASLLIKGVEGEAMLLQLDNKGIAVSTGSACSSGSLEPSHVLLSIGCPPEIAHGSLRISLGRFTTEERRRLLPRGLPAHRRAAALDVARVRADVRLRRS